MRLTRWIKWIKKTWKHRFAITPLYIYHGFVCTSILLPVMDVTPICLDHGHKSWVQCCIPHTFSKLLCFKLHGRSCIGKFDWTRKVRAPTFAPVHQLPSMPRVCIIIFFSNKFCMMLVNLCICYIFSSFIWPWQCWNTVSALAALRSPFTPFHRGALCLSL